MSVAVMCRPGYPGAEIVLEQPSGEKPECGNCDARPGDGGLLDSRPVSRALGGA